MKYILEVTCIYDVGQRLDSLGNPHQEDNIFPSKENLTADTRLFILCDGMGGHDAGEVASQAVCDAMSKSILNDDHNKEGVFTPEEFENALDAAFKELDQRDTGAEKKMGTTLAFLKLHEKGAFIAHMGDSRVYHIRPGKTGEDTLILYETPDHSLINDLLKVEAITKEEARTSKQKNVITRALQPRMERRPKAEVYETSDIRVGDYFYLCSDGMLEDTDMEDGTLIRNIFSEKNGDINKKTQILTDVTSNNRDNHSAFLIHITEVTDKIFESTKEVPKKIEEDKYNDIIDSYSAECSSQEKTDSSLIDNSITPKKHASVHETRMSASNEIDSKDTDFANRPDKNNKDDIKKDTLPVHKETQHQSKASTDAVQLKNKVRKLKMIIGTILGIIILLIASTWLKFCQSENKDTVKKIEKSVENKVKTCKYECP